MHWMFASFITSICSRTMHQEDLEMGIIKFIMLLWMPEITQMFPWPMDWCIRVMKCILVGSLGFRGNLVDLESTKELKPFGLTKGDMERERRICSPLSTNHSHSPKWGLISFNSENVALDQFKIDLLKLTDYSVLYHKRMLSRALCFSKKPRVVNAFLECYQFKWLEKKKQHIISDRFFKSDKDGNQIICLGW